MSTDGDSPKKTSVSRAIYRILDARYKELGPVTYHQASVLVLFVLLVLLWCFRDPKFVPGWGSLITVGKTKFVELNGTCSSTSNPCGVDPVYAAEQHTELAVDDATAGMIVVFLLFVLPSRLNFWPFTSGPGNNGTNILSDTFLQ